MWFRLLSKLDVAQLVVKLEQSTSIVGLIRMVKVLGKFSLDQVEMKGAEQGGYEDELISDDHS